MSEQSTEMTISQYDMAVFQAEQKRLERAHDRSMARLRTVAICFGYLSAAAALIGVAIVIWLSLRGPSASEQIDSHLRDQCTAEHGTWVRLYDGGDSGNKGSGTCLFGREGDQ